MVGCVIVKNGRVVAKGYHRKFGGPHAERFALKRAGFAARGATMYVNLEPCSYYGKTPPCVDAVIRSGTREVIVATKDPNPLVSGRGIAALRRAGVRVVFGVLQKEASELNEKFFKFVRTGVPFVALKVAQTLDGKIASPDGRSRWITSPEARRLVHQLRSEHDAVLVGAGTVMTDDPQLTVRHVRGRNPVRVIIDGRLRSRLGAKVFRVKGGTSTKLFVSTAAARTKTRKVAALRGMGVEVIPLPAIRWHISLRHVVRELGKRNIASILVEGGREMFTGFLRSRLVDKAYVFTAPRILGEGIAAFGGLGRSTMARSSMMKKSSLQSVGQDTLFIGYFS